MEDEAKEAETDPPVLQVTIKNDSNNEETVVNFTLDFSDSDSETKYSEKQVDYEIIDTITEIVDMDRLLAGRFSNNYCMICRTSYARDPYLSLFSFPAEPIRRKAWVLLCGLEDKELKGYERLCHKHFPDNFFKLSKNRKLLTNFAIPTIDIPKPELIEKCKTMVEFQQQRKISEFSTNPKPQLVSVLQEKKNKLLAIVTKPSDKTVGAVYLNETTNEPIPFSHLCRLCFRKSDTLTQRLRPWDKELAFRYLRINVSDCDKSHPSTICSECIEILNEFDSYRVRCFQLQENVNNFATSETLTIDEEQPIDFGKRYYPTGTKLIDEQRIDVSTELLTKNGTKEPTTPKKVRVDEQISYQCAICNKSYKSEKDLKGHHYIYHTKLIEKPKVFHPCTYCGKQYEKNQLNKHIQRTHVVKKYTCDSCGKSYGSANLLSTHKNLSHEQSGPCPTCGKILTKRGLEEHVKLCGKNIEEFMVQCELCPTKLKTYNKYLRHRHVVHEMNSNFTCQYCGKAFFRKDAHREHEAMHRGDQSKICEWCEKKFTFGANYYSHVNKMHPVEYKRKCQEKEKQREEKLLQSAGKLKN